MLPACLAVVFRLSYMLLSMLSCSVSALLGYSRGRFLPVTELQAQGDLLRSEYTVLILFL